ncbi:uncharacterized protein LOC130801896 isoform X2 [Amaranthus tricolor]|uniref:uncharacterized protein LOC130801896 isoform X2 n=1 Tax=Amaranthus tricolor TaxID=29722 RepID=UPI00258B726E|nr:uncharacterized protein LOC130801896 isoform X2 [Amaranthus tricolor]
MVEAGVAPRFRPSSTSIASQFRDNTKPITIRAGLLLHAVTKFKSLQPIRIHSQFHQCPSTYSSRMSTDIPFYETPGASFDQYLEDKPRVFTAIFPDKRRSQQLNEIRWELQGLDNVVPPDHFSLGVQGALYSDRRGTRSRLKGQLEMKISVVTPPVLVLVPEDVRRSVSESVLKRLLENMKDKVNGNLLADYSKFRRER